MDGIALCMPCLVYAVAFMKTSVEQSAQETQAADSTGWNGS